MTSYFVSIQMAEDIKYLSYDEHQVVGKGQLGIKQRGILSF